MQQHEAGLIYSSVQLHPFSTMVALHGESSQSRRSSQPSPCSRVCAGC